MKALTFKKTAVAAALLATAGVAQAAGEVKVGVVTTAADLSAVTTTVTDMSKTASAEQLLAGAQSLAPTADTLIKYTIPSNGADLIGGSLITFQFKNGGVNESVANAPLVFVAGTNGAVAETNIELFQATAASSTDPSLTKLIYRVKDGQTITKGTQLYLVDAAANDTGDTNTDFDFATAATLPLVALKGASAGAKATVGVTVDNASAVVDDSIYTAKEVSFAEVFDGLAITKFTTTTSTVDFANNALTFVGGSKTSKASGLVISVNSNIDKSTDGSREAATDVPVAESNVDVMITLTTTKCDMLATTNGLVLTNGTDTVALTKAASGCSWTATLDGGSVDLETAFSLTATVNGTTALAAQDWNVAYEAKVGAVGDLEKTSNTALKWSTDVQTSQAHTFPFLTAFNNNASTFSLVKIDNQAVASATDLAMSGMVEQIEFVDGKATSTFIPFDNYYLGQIAAKSLGQISGDQVIDALLDTSKAPANFGFKSTALAGLKKDAVHHMSVTISVSTATTKNGSIGKIEGFNASGLGRTSITVGGQ